MTTSDPPSGVAPAPLAGRAARGAGPSLVERLYDGALPPERVASTLLGAEHLFPTAAVRRGASVRALPPSPRRLGVIRIPAAGRACDLADYLAVNRVAGLLILRDGAIVHEAYTLGLGPAGRWPSFSVAKSVSSTLLGAAVAAGAIGGVTEPVTRYLPVLTGSAYDGVSIQDLLEMCSGVRWNEAYTDPGSDRRRWLELQIAGRPGSLLGFMGSLPRAAAPGTRFNYNTGETFLIGALLEAATGRTLAAYLGDTIWARAGMESDASWWLESPGGAGIGGTGLAATLRDYGRFALFVLDDGVVDGARVVPVGWFAESGAPRERGGARLDYGYQWWPLPPGDPIQRGAFKAQGIFGQRIYLNPAGRLAIVLLSARSQPTGAEVVDDDAFFGAVARVLA